MSSQDPQRQPDRTDIERTQELLGDRYELNWIIGRGGMSTVWLAWDKQNERDVAVKILKPEYTDNPEFRTRFRNESHAAARLHSPNVVETYDYGEVQNGGTIFCFIIMEYVRGESLADVLTRERSLPEALALDVLAQAAVGLQAIHEAGMVHRDIKPGNLLITSDGVVKVTDFGIAKAAEAVPLTRTGMVVGTAQYVSPEQAQGQSVGPASDVYSLGVVGFEMFAGHRLFTGESTVSVAIKHISSAPPPLPENISPHMRELINICLRKNPQTRYADGAELAAAAALVSQGQRPPQPHRVPNVNVDSHPLTEQLGTIAQGPGTRVPPMQGPAGGPRGRTPAAGPTPGSAGVPAMGAAARAGNVGASKAQTNNPVSKGATPVIVVGVVALLALLLAGYFWATSSDDEAPNKETTTVTNEVTSEPPMDEGPAQPVNPAPQQPNRNTRQPQPEQTSVESTVQEQPTEEPETQPEQPSPNPTNTANTGDISGGGNGNGANGGGAGGNGGGAGNGSNNSGNGNGGGAGGAQGLGAGNGAGRGTTNSISTGTATGTAGGTNLAAFPGATGTTIG